jgi:hypothetical protein
MPRVPEAKRPDFVLQFNEARMMNFILLESKQAIQDVYPNMGTLLTQFFTGSNTYLGLKKRPAWHRKDVKDEKWSFIPPDENDDIRFWFKELEESRVRYWPGFAFALTPEYVAKPTDIDNEGIAKQLGALLRSNSGLDIAILIGWIGEHHMPFAIRAYSEKFEGSLLAPELDEFLKPVSVK